MKEKIDNQKVDNLNPETPSTNSNKNFKGAKERGSPKFKRSLRYVAYVLKPQTLLGSILAFVIIQGVDFFKDFKALRSEEVISVRERLASELKNLPIESTQMERVIDNIRRLFKLYESEGARKKISMMIGELEESRARMVEQEDNTRAKEEALQKARQDEEEAKSKEDQQAAEIARKDAEKKAAEKKKADNSLYETQKKIIKKFAVWEKW